MSKDWPCDQRYAASVFEDGLTHLVIHSLNLSGMTALILPDDFPVVQILSAGSRSGRKCCVSFINRIHCQYEHEHRQGIFRLVKMDGIVIG